MAENNFDVVVIGSGPGGYVGAIRSAQLGLKTAIVEKDPTLGGTCLNVGCIPSKALLESSEKFSESQHDLKKHGVVIDGLKLDLSTMLSRKTKIVGDLTKGVAFLMKKNKVTVFTGRGEMTGANQVSVHGNDGNTQVINTKNIMLATGSVPVEIPSMPFDGQYVVSSTEALSFSEVPQNLVVIGGGAIGLELGSVWCRLGSKVTVMEGFKRIAGASDESLSTELLKVLKKQGMDFKLETKVSRTEITPNNKVKVYFTVGGGSEESLEADKVLVAVGRRPFSKGVGLETIGINRDPKDRIIVDDHFRTNIPNIYAIGDVIAGPMLAHKAEEEGVAVAEIIAGKPGHVNYNTVPSVIYTWPEVASVGLTEGQCKEKGIEIKTGKFPFAANGRAKALGNTDGFVKMIADKNTDRILGCHIIGPRASDILSEVVVAMEFGGSAEDVARSFHGHPTLSEIVREAALDVDKKARQF